MTENIETKKTIFSGIQPTGTLQLGNYLGAVKNFVKLQDEYNCLFCAVDLHAITVRQNPADFRKSCNELLALYIAAGLDPEKNLLYLQSHVSAHAELAWLLNCYTYMGELNRMTQFKDKSKKNEDNINAGLFTYPVLMAADILLFKTDLVPIGDDQKQHLELARDIAIRFNGIYGDVFTIPEGYFSKNGARIKSLQDPLKKMSKSDNVKSFIGLLDEPNVIINKFKSAVTDSDNEVRFAIEKPGISNLLTIYSTIKEKTIEECEKEFAGVGYGEFKLAVGEAVVAEIKPIQEKFNEIKSEKEYLQKIIKQNSEQASYLANKTLYKVKKKIGFVV